MNKCQRIYIPLSVYVKHCNHCIPAGNISRVKILHVLIIFHVHIIRNTYKPLPAQQLYHIFSLFFSKVLNTGIRRVRICNFNPLIKLHALLCCPHCLVLQTLLFFCCQDTDRLCPSINLFPFFLRQSIGMPPNIIIAFWQDNLVRYILKTILTEWTDYGCV